MALEMTNTLVLYKYVKMYDDIKCILNQDTNPFVRVFYHFSLTDVLRFGIVTGFMYKLNLTFFMTSVRFYVYMILYKNIYA